MSNEKRMSHQKRLPPLGQSITASAMIVAISVASACTPIRDKHGFVPDEALPTAVQPEIDTKSTVLARLGSPSAVANFSDRVWYYISYDETQFAFYNPKVTKRNITVIEFSEKDIVEKVSQVGIKAGRRINYVNRATPTRGKQLGLLEQLFGTIGRLPIDPSAQQDGPGNGGRGGQGGP